MVDLTWIDRIINVNLLPRHRKKADFGEDRILGAKVANGNDETGDEEKAHAFLYCFVTIRVKNKSICSC